MPAPEQHHAAPEGNSGTPRAPTTDVSVVDALERLTQAGIEILENRAELLQLEIRAAGSRLMTGALLIVTGTIFFVVAWVALVGASFFVLRDFLGEARSLGVIVAANALIGFAVMAIGRRRMASVRPSA